MPSLTDQSSLESDRVVRAVQGRLSRSYPSASEASMLQLAREEVAQYRRYRRASLVSPLQFIEDPDYLGSEVADLHPNWKRELAYVLDPENDIIEWILRGAIGTGKSTCAAVAQCYKIYELTQLEDPAAYFGLLPHSILVIGVFSITLRKADRGYELMKQFLDASPYFRELHPRRLRPDNPISIPDKRLRVEPGSLAEHALSENMYGFMLDEANFFKKSRDPTSQEERTRAYDLYQQAQRRQESRFLQQPGLSCLLSSQRTQTEFLEERVRLAVHNPRVHVTTFALWDTKTADQYPSNSRFPVMIGDGVRSSRVLDPGEISPAGYEVVRVPEEHRRSFEEDTDEALRDLAGQAVTGMGYFFSRREAVHKCIDHARVHPFTVEVVTQLGVKVDVTLADLFRADLLFRTVRSRSTPIVDPGVPRCAHVDIGLTGDSLGLAIGHLTPTSRLYYDILLRVRAPSKDEVDLDEIIAFFRYLRHLGFHFGSITYDQYQSRHSLQKFHKLQFDAGRLSIQLEEHKELRRLIYAGTASYYSYPPFLKEVRELMKDPKGGCPDHPVHGSNDVEEAAAGVAVALGSATHVDEAPRSRAVLLPLVGSLPSGY